jgi:hypothetical protein
LEIGQSLDEEGSRLFAVKSVDALASVMQMRQWSITLHGPVGILSSVDTGESEFVVGTEDVSDVFNVVGDGVVARHAWVWISEAWSTDTRLLSALR